MPTKTGHHVGGGIGHMLQVRGDERYGGQTSLSTAGAESAEVREALSHCPQCGSGKFTEYRKEEPTAT
jgi:hypothetical protein